MNQLAMTTVAAIGGVPPLYWLAPVGGVIALLMARGFSASVMRLSEGEPEMIQIAEAVRQGAMAYLNRQYRIVGSSSSCWWCPRSPGPSCNPRCRRWAFPSPGSSPACAAGSA